jgi:copper resistance protein B
MIFVSMLSAASQVLAQEHPQQPVAATSETAKQSATQSESRHIPPDAPQHSMPDMSEARMMELMEMDDTGNVGTLLLDQLEVFRDGGHTVLGWDGHAWYGNDYNKLWMKSEGEGAAGESDGRAELLWDHVFARWWSVQAGIRQDFGADAPRTWGAIGVQGLAPHWFDIDAAFYLSEGGRAAGRFKAEYELLFTQRLILQPQIEMNLYSKDDQERGIGSGLSDLAIGLRLRYEFRREFAPYVGVSFLQRFGRTADFAHTNGEDSSEMRAVAGMRVWF